MEGFPMRKWSIQIHMLNENGEDVPANIFSKVTYLLHASFGERAKQGMLINYERMFQTQQIQSHDHAAIPDFRGRMGRV
jgi:hypothetical protein